MCNSLGTLEKLIGEGYHVTEIEYIPLDNEVIKETDNDTQVIYLRTINDILKFDRKKLINTYMADPKAKGKFIIIMNRPKEKLSIAVPTRRLDCLEKAEQRFEYQKETVAINISVYCSVSGDIEYTIDPIIEQMNEVLGWLFKPTKPNTFHIEKRLETTDRNLAEEDFELLKLLLLYLAMTRKVGIKIDRHFITNIPRFGFTISGVGQMESITPMLDQREMDGFQNFISLKPEVVRVADGLNQVYLLSSNSSRLALLWAITESTFKGKGNRLFSKNEVNSIIESLTIPDNNLESVRNALSSLTTESRNKVIAKKIASTLNLNEDEVMENMGNISKIRAKCLHEYAINEQKIGIAVQYLRNILELFLEKESQWHFLGRFGSFSNVNLSTSTGREQK